MSSLLYFYPLARRMQWGRIKMNLCAWLLCMHRLITIATSFSDSPRMLLPSIAQRQNDWNSLHLWIPTFDSAFNWVFCIFKCMHCMLGDAHTHSHGQWEMNRVSRFPLISAFHYAGEGIGGYFTKRSLSPVFFYEMEIKTVGEKCSTCRCQS